MDLSLKLGFTSLVEETDNIDLPTEGKMPSWLNGTLIRNGAAQFEVGNDKYNHWFDGLAMLHKFSFKDGKVSYTNKFLKGNTYVNTMRKGAFVYSEFATATKKTLPYRVFQNITRQFTDNASVNVAKVDDSYIALTETPPRVEFDIGTLETIGRFDYGDKIRGHITTVHPHYDYNREEIYNYITKFSLNSSYIVYKIEKGSSKRKIVSSIPVKEASYMHTFGITDNYIVLTEFPLKIDHFRLLRTGTPLVENLTWKPQLGTVFNVIDKSTGKIVRKVKTDSVFGFHHINCFEDGNTLVVDLVGYENSDVIASVFLNKLLSGDFSMPTPKTYRYRLDLENSTATRTELTSDFTEFPRINYDKFNGKEYNYIYGLMDHNSDGFLAKLVKGSIKDKSSKYWFKEGHFPGEPVFVPSPDSSSEDDGVVFSLILDTEKSQTYLLVLDAITFEEKGKAYLPFAVPFGSHGQFYEI